MADCIFCKLAASAPHDGLPMTSHFYGKYDIKPASPGHALLIARTHIESAFDLTKEQWADLNDALHQTKKVLDAKFHAAAYNIAVNDGKAAGRLVDHVHIHLIPRYEGSEKSHTMAVRELMKGLQP